MIESKWGLYDPDEDGFVHVTTTVESHDHKPLKPGEVSGSTEMAVYINIESSVWGTGLKGDKGPVSLPLEVIDSPELLLEELRGLLIPESTAEDYILVLIENNIPNFEDVVSLKGLLQ